MLKAMRHSAACHPQRAYTVIFLMVVAIVIFSIGCSSKPNEPPKEVSLRTLLSLIDNNELQAEKYKGAYIRTTGKVRGKIEKDSFRIIPPNSDAYQFAGAECEFVSEQEDMVAKLRGGLYPYGDVVEVEGTVEGWSTFISTSITIKDCRLVSGRVVPPPPTPTPIAKIKTDDRGHLFFKEICQQVKSLEGWVSESGCTLGSYGFSMDGTKLLFYVENRVGHGAVGDYWSAESIVGSNICYVVLADLDSLSLSFTPLNCWRMEPVMHSLSLSPDNRIAAVVLRNDEERRRYDKAPTSPAKDLYGDIYLLELSGLESPEPRLLVEEARNPHWSFTGGYVFYWSPVESDQVLPFYRLSAWGGEDIRHRGAFSVKADGTQATRLFVLEDICTNELYDAAAPVEEAPAVAAGAEPLPEIRHGDRKCYDYGYGSADPRLASNRNDRLVAVTGDGSLVSIRPDGTDLQTEHASFYSDHLAEDPTKTGNMYGKGGVLSSVLFSQHKQQFIENISGYMHIIDFTDSEQIKRALLTNLRGGYHGNQAFGPGGSEILTMYKSIRHTYDAEIAKNVFHIAIVSIPDGIFD